MIKYVDKLCKIFCSTKSIGKKIPLQQNLPSDKELLKRTLHMCLPSITEAFLIAIVGVVDSYMVSGLGIEAISAVGLTTQPKFIFLVMFMALSISVSAVVARRRGEGKMDEANRVLQQALLIGVACSILLSILAVVFADTIMGYSGTKADTHAYAVAYFRIILGGQVFQVITMIINAAQRGTGNTKIAMKTNAVANGVNVVFNYLLITGKFGFPRMGVRGAAIATVLGSIIASIMAVRSVTRSGAPFSLFTNFKFKLDKYILSTIGKLAAPTFFEQMCTRVGFYIFAMIVANLGTPENAAHHIGLNFMSISFAFADGLSMATVSLVGRSLGEKRYDLALIYSSICQRIGVCCSILVALVYVPFGRQLYGLFSDVEQVKAYGAQIMPVMAYIVFVQISMLIYFAALRAAGDVKYVAIVLAISIGVLRPLSAWVLTYPMGFGLIGAWIGTAIDQTVRLVLGYRRYKQLKWLKIEI